MYKVFVFNEYIYVSKCVSHYNTLYKVNTEVRHFLLFDTLRIKSIENGIIVLIIIIDNDSKTDMDKFM